jgi:glucose/mannose transport system permease protein
MTGPGQAFVTDMPSLNMFQTTFQGNEFAQGAAIAVILLLLIAAFIVPYLISTLRQGENS